MKKAFKKAGSLLKKSDFVRWILTAFMIYKVYSETGIYTTANFIFIFIALESLLMIERLKSERLKQLTTFLADRYNRYNRMKGAQK